MSPRKERSKKPKLKPLDKFDFGLVQERLIGIFINIDRSLEKQAISFKQSANAEGFRQLSLLIVMIRIASNSYTALCFLLTDLDKDARRKPNFVLVTPPVNRQIMDLLFTLVYMRDDFGSRSLAYERAGWRAFREEYDRYHSKYGSSREWKPFFTEQKRILKMMAAPLKISKVENNNPSLIDRWKGPFKLSQKPTASGPFLQWLEKWVYSDTSAEAHLTGIGLFNISPFLLSNLATAETRTMIEERAIHQYKARHFSRTAMTALAIATEIDVQCNLGNKTAIAYVWRILSEYSADANEMYTERYGSMLA
jgi:hypothetical protein